MKFFQLLQAFFTARFPRKTNISGFGDIRFYAVLLCFGISFHMFIRDPFFLVYGSFRYAQGTVILFTAWVLVTSFSWEMLFFGKPCGQNLTLHAAAVFPVSLFLARITGKASATRIQTSLLGEGWDALSGLSKQTFGFSLTMPNWMTDLFSNWKAVLLILLILLVLSLRNQRLKISGTLLLLIVPFLYFIAFEVVTMYFIIGSVFLLTGLCLLFSRYDRLIYYENAAARIQRIAPNIDETLAAVIFRVMAHMEENGKITESSLFSIVSGQYSSGATANCNFNDSELSVISQEIARKLVFEYNLADISGDMQGIVLTPKEDLFRNKNLLGAVSAIPRIVFLFVFAFLWMIMPIDLIPDSIPFFGALDDAAVAVFSQLAMKDSLKKS